MSQENNQFSRENQDEPSTSGGIQQLVINRLTDAGTGEIPVQPVDKEYLAFPTDQPPRQKRSRGNSSYPSTLKPVLLAKLDEEHQNYRLAIEKTLDGVQILMQETLHSVEQQLNYFHYRLHQLEGRLGSDPLPPLPAWSNSRRIRWGSTPEEIRKTVIQQARRLEAMGKELKVETIKTEVPGMLRWLYGERAVFEGIKGLSRTMREDNPFIRDYLS